AHSVVVGEHPRSGHRCERDRRDQLGVVAAAVVPVRARPSPVEHVFAVTVRLGVERHRADERGAAPCGEQPRRPAGLRGGAAGLVERREPRMRHERLRAGDALPARWSDRSECHVVADAQRSCVSGHGYYERDWRGHHDATIVAARAPRLKGRLSRSRASSCKRRLAHSAEWPRASISSMRIALAQLNQTLGDLAGNARAIVDAIARAQGASASLVVTPELSFCGYPPEDLLLRPAFVDACAAELAALAGRARGCAAIVGFPERANGRRYNAAALLRDGRVERVYRKERLPNYTVFDEERYFTPGDAPCVFELDGRRVG